MPSMDKSIERSLIPPDAALQHASLAVVMNVKTEIPVVGAWTKCHLSKTPVTIHDINGQPLFYDYAVRQGGAEVGYVRTSASEMLGPPVVAVEEGPRSWDFEVAKKKLLARVKKDLAGLRIAQPKLVCYSYPKLGVMYEGSGSRGVKRAIYDVASLGRIEDKPKKPRNEGSYAWSFYDSLGQRERASRTKLYRKYQKLLEAVPNRLRKEHFAGQPLAGAIEKLGFPFKLSVTRRLQYCSHYEYYAPRSHHCFSLHGQEVDDYCAVATCQMILCYYRYYYAQDDIAPALGYTAGSGCPSDQSPGYEDLTHDCLDASFDNAPTFAKARKEIDELHPFKSGIPGHARACAGYSRSIWPFVTSQRLYIYDPWPWNADLSLAGTTSWEDWDSITHTNYVTAQIASS